MICVVLFSALAFAVEKHFSEKPEPEPVPREFAEITFPAQIPGSHVLDQTNIITPTHYTRMNRTANRLLLDEKVYFTLVLLPSLDEFNAGHLTPRQYVNRLHENWGIGFTDRDYSLLMFFTKKEKHLKFVFGSAWTKQDKHNLDQIWLNKMHPVMNRGDWSYGLLVGLQHIDTYVRSLKLPPPASPCEAGDDGFATCAVAEKS